MRPAKVLQPNEKWTGPSRLEYPPIDDSILSLSNAAQCFGGQTPFLNGLIAFAEFNSLPVRWIKKTTAVPPSEDGKKDPGRRNMKPIFVSAELAAWMYDELSIKRGVVVQGTPPSLRSLARYHEAKQAAQEADNTTQGAAQ